MDPSHSVTNDPRHPQFTAYPPPFNSNSNPFSVENHPFYASAVAPPTNNYQAPPPLPQTPPVPPHPSLTHPPYSEMICTAIAALNEPDGSSKQAISRYIERVYTGIPSAHAALLTHHLKTLKNSGNLMMVKKSYKFPGIPPPTSVAAAASLEPLRSDFTSETVNDNQHLPNPVASSTPQTLKRGRGRPPKPKPDVQQSIIVQTNGTELPISPPDEMPQTQSPIRRPPGRPRKDGASPTVEAPPSGGVETLKRRGRPPSGRAAGRERKPTVVSAPASVFPYVANGGVRRRGRPKKVDTGASSSIAPPAPNAKGGGEQLAIVVAKRRGRPPKIGGVMRKPMKPNRGYIRSGKPVGRPRKNAPPRGASGQQDAGYGELKKRFEFIQEKAKEIVNVLKVEIGGSENQAVVQAIQALEELTTATTMEKTEKPRLMEEVQQDDEHHEAQPEPELQAQTEAEAMQEALF